MITRYIAATGPYLSTSVTIQLQTKYKPNTNRIRFSEGSADTTKMNSTTLIEEPKPEPCQQDLMAKEQQRNQR